MKTKIIQDKYQIIRESRSSYRETELHEITPNSIEKSKVLNTRHQSSASFKPNPKIRTRAQLDRCLKQTRRQYRPFIKDLAPPLSSFREEYPLTDFDWRIETAADKGNFRNVLDGAGQWEQVTVPHYGEPLGKAVTYYRATFALTEEQLENHAAILAFKAVDYKAHVFVNDAHVGSHEGFFAPFSCDCSEVLRTGDNVLLVKVENDITIGSFLDATPGQTHTGNKIYAATGLGYDDPEQGWHHCPPGMGIYQDVTLSLRPIIHITDIFVRPLPHENRAEAWIEVTNTQSRNRIISLDLSLFGQNFRKTVFKHVPYEPSTDSEVGYGDDLQIAKLLAIGMLGATLPLEIGAGPNTFRLSFTMKDFRWWTPEEPWLYQLQVILKDDEGEAFDAYKQQFGMRSFVMDEDKDPKGEFRLNGKPIRLRGANTMGHLQQCVYKKDVDQLMDDIFLAKIANMNFLRITQRPVQPEIYDMCDRLGMMTQTDLPLFGQVRRQHVCELARQAEEMEKLVRSHPCNIINSYMNEHFPNGNNQPHRNLTRAETEAFFDIATATIKLVNPERVIKPTDGDYDPPAPSYPDRHCYTAWYNGHGVDIGKLNKGYWQSIKEGWYFGCGEYGVEAIDPVDVMTQYYPSEWLPQSLEEEKTWSPNQVVQAQTGMFHYLFYDTPENLQGWVDASHTYQAWATRIMTEAFRRENRMNSFAIHLFIDAFPAGWMKAIMDVDRNPKQAYFTFRDALAPLLPNLRTDRFKYFSGETMSLEAWICNDRHEVPKNTWLHYQFEKRGEVIQSGRTRANIPLCSSEFQGMLELEAPDVVKRTPLTVRLALMQKGKILNDCALDIEVLPPVPALRQTRPVYLFGANKGQTAHLAKELGLKPSLSKKPSDKALILIDDFRVYQQHRSAINKAVKAGALAVFMELPAGKYRIAGTDVEAQTTSMGPMHFVSRKTGHAIVDGFHPNDFRLWHDPETDCFAPLMDTTFMASGWDPILTSGNLNKEGKWASALAVAETCHGQGRYIISQIRLAGLTSTNPTAKLFVQKLLELY